MALLYVFKTLALSPVLVVMSCCGLGFVLAIQETQVFQMSNMTSSDALELKSMALRSKIRCVQECQVVQACVSAKYNTNTRQCTLFSSFYVSELQPEEVAYAKPLIVTQVGKYT